MRECLSLILKMKINLHRGAFITILLAAIFFGCKKDKIETLEKSAVTGSGVVDLSRTFDKPHSNVNWQSQYMAYSSGMLTGRFNNFSFMPKFMFNEADLSQCSLNAWVQLSSVDSGEPGRDGI